MAKYPTGVENHGGFLRIWFIYKGKRVRESLGLPDTPKNRKAAGELRATVCYGIKTGNFNYSANFPESPNVAKYGGQKKPVTMSELMNKWIAIKEPELTPNARNRYKSYLDTYLEIIGPDKMVSAFTQEDALLARKELLTGWQRIRGKNPAPNGKGRSVPTVNSYTGCLKSMLAFAANNGYMEKNPLDGVAPLKKSRPEPDPLTQDEYGRILTACSSEQIRNMVAFAVNTGMRHGEIISLAWEDIDTEKWTVKVVRNQAMPDYFGPPKTESGERVIQLTGGAIEALKLQMPLTRMGVQHQIDVRLRQKDLTRKDDCTFVFSPRLTARNGNESYWYSNGSISAAWKRALRKAGVRMRKSYETRHTFACWALSSGANPNFIAHQMGHASAQMLYNVYGRWMSENNLDQMAIMNAKFTKNVPSMPHKKTG